MLSAIWIRFRMMGGPSLYFPDDSRNMPYKLTNTQWRQLQPYVSSRARRGRPPADARRTLEAVVYVLSSGCRWDELPQEMGSHITAWRRWRKWKEDGTMDIIQAAIPVPLSAPPKSRV